MPDFARPASPLGARDRGFLEDVQQLLLGLTAPDLAPRALQVGYDDAEHQQGWRLWREAAGQDRPFNHFLGAESRRVVASDPAQKARYTRLDRFENVWFPRTRTGIKRFVPAEHREEVERAFFHEMPQQPEGPLVVGSVDKYLSRLEQLREGSVPGGRAVWQALVKKGLTEELLADVRNTIDAARRQEPPPAPAQDAEAVQAAAARQIAAVAELRLWYNDWAQTFRQELNQRELKRLGLAAQPKAKRATVDENDGEGPEEPV